MSLGRITIHRTYDYLFFNFLGIGSPAKIVFTAEIFRSIELQCYQKTQRIKYLDKFRAENQKTMETQRIK